MQTLEMLFQFFAIPLVIIMFGIVMYRGEPRRYKIVRESDDLGKEKYEVWFKYGGLLPRFPWCLEGSFYTLKEAEDFVSGKNPNREIVKEGAL